MWDIALFARMPRLPQWIEAAYVKRGREQLSKACRLTPPAPHKRNPQLLVDVSAISRGDSGTGVQRVVRGILIRLLASPPPGFEIKLVSVTRKRPYRYVEWHGIGLSKGFGAAVTVQSGDIFLGLDLSAHMIPQHFNQLAGWKRQGVKLDFILHDLLAVHHPEWFSRSLSLAMWRWNRAIAMLADAVFCNSRATENDFLQWLHQRYGFTQAEVKTIVFPMGSDFQKTAPSKGLPNGFEALCTKLQDHQCVLMVGTVEPRKGHAQAMAAFEALWQSGHDYHLVIVGKPGWKTQKLQTKLKSLAQTSNRLVWLDDASDEALEKLYQLCSGVLVASLAEGFGLPLVEALAHDKPVLVRDLPVFREHVSPRMTYFESQDGASLATTIVQWLKTAASPAATGGTVVLSSWDDTVRVIVGALNDQA